MLDFALVFIFPGALFFERKIPGLYARLGHLGAPLGQK